MLGALAAVPSYRLRQASGAVAPETFAYEDNSDDEVESVLSQEAVDVTVGGRAC
jgi:hypothetical protein